MRSREEIEKEMATSNGKNSQRLQLEMLIDIRELLDTINKKITDDN
jgi:hypothetical protein